VGPKATTAGRPLRLMPQHIPVYLPFSAGFHSTLTEWTSQSRSDSLKQRRYYSRQRISQTRFLRVIPVASIVLVAIKSPCRHA
jgi:hypothetical protein